MFSSFFVPQLLKFLHINANWSRSELKVLSSKLKLLGHLNVVYGKYDFENLGSPLHLTAYWNERVMNTGTADFKYAARRIREQLINNRK